MSKAGALPDIARCRPLLLVAPHPDDAALSCAALIAREEPIDVLTVFTGAPDPPRQGEWDRTTGFASSAESMPRRIAEERAAFAGTHHGLSLLGGLELQYATEETRSADAKAIATAVATWLANHPSGLVAVPAGAGKLPGRMRSRIETLKGHVGTMRHPDHVFVRDVVLECIRDSPILLYEEFPYRWGRRADGEVRRLEDSHGRLATKTCVGVDRCLKAARIFTYATQTPHLRFGERRVDHAHDVPDDECYWVLVPS